MTDRSYIINQIFDYSTTTYLELGVDRKATFNDIKIINKECVDKNIKTNPTYCMSTDDFFKQNDKKYDIIFIDANHSLSYVYKDYINSCNISNKLIMIHDLVPPTKNKCVGGACGDGFKILNYFNDNNIDYCTLNRDYGLTFIFPPFKKFEFENINDISYENFMSKKLNLYNIEEIVNVIKRKININC